MARDTSTRKPIGDGVRYVVLLIAGLAVVTAAIQGSVDIAIVVCICYAIWHVASWPSERPEPLPMPPTSLPSWTSELAGAVKTAGLYGRLRAGDTTVTLYRWPWDRAVITVTLRPHDRVQLTSETTAFGDMSIEEGPIEGPVPGLRITGASPLEALYALPRHRRAVLEVLIRHRARISVGRINWFTPTHDIPSDVLTAMLTLANAAPIRIPEAYRKRNRRALDAELIARTVDEEEPLYRCAWLDALYDRRTGRANRDRRMLDSLRRAVRSSEHVDLKLALAILDEDRSAMTSAIDALRAQPARQDATEVVVGAIGLAERRDMLDTRLGEDPDSPLLWLALGDAVPEARATLIPMLSRLGADDESTWVRWMAGAPEQVAILLCQRFVASPTRAGLTAITAWRRAEVSGHSPMPAEIWKAERQLRTSLLADQVGALKLVDDVTAGALSPATDGPPSAS